MFRGLCSPLSPPLSQCRHQTGGCDPADAGCSDLPTTGDESHCLALCFVWLPVSLLAWCLHHQLCISHLLCLLSPLPVPCKTPSETRPFFSQESSKFTFGMMCMWILKYTTQTSGVWIRAPWWGGPAYLCDWCLFISYSQSVFGGGPRKYPRSELISVYHSRQSAWQCRWWKPNLLWVLSVPWVTLVTSTPRWECIFLSAGMWVHIKHSKVLRE